MRTATQRFPTLSSMTALERIDRHRAVAGATTLTITALTASQLIAVITLTVGPGVYSLDNGLGRNGLARVKARPHIASQTQMRRRTPHTETGDNGRPNGSMNKVTGPCQIGDVPLQYVDGVRQLAVLELRSLDHNHGVLGNIGPGVEERQYGVWGSDSKLLSPSPHRSTKSVVAM